jgi:hypothetical protein
LGTPQIADDFGSVGCRLLAENYLQRPHSGTERLGSHPGGRRFESG